MSGRGSPPGRRAGRRAVFLDRDGTLIYERDFLADPAGVELLPGVGEALRRLHDAGLALVVVTNQSGIARGLIREDQYHAVQRRLGELLEAEGVEIDGARFCPHHPDFTGRCDCRKPATGMYRLAAEELGLELAASFYVGDRLRDVLPAAELGGTGILVRTGFGLREEPDLEAAWEEAVSKARHREEGSPPSSSGLGGGRGAPAHLHSVRASPLVVDDLLEASLWILSGVA